MFILSVGDCVVDIGKEELDTRAGSLTQNISCSICYVNLYELDRRSFVQPVQSSLVYNL